MESGLLVCLLSPDWKKVMVYWTTEVRRAYAAEGV